MPSQQHDDIVDLLRTASSSATGPSTIEASRELLDANGDLFPVRSDVTVAPLDIDGIACERYEPAVDDTGGIVLYLHGGAYIGGSLRSHRPLCARIAHATGTPVIAVQYRLAPEHPHPAALRDATTVHRWLVAEGPAGRRVVIAGDSAGGGLTAATLLSLAADGDRAPAGAVLISAWLDLTLAGESITTKAEADPMLDAAALARSAVAYAGDALTDPLVSPVHAPPEALATLPPLLLMAGTADILVDDTRLFARLAADAGVAVDVDVEEGLVHVWPFLDGIPEAAEAMERIGAWVRTRLSEED